jgi:cellulose synthase operon protein C
VMRLTWIGAAALAAASALTAQTLADAEALWKQRDFQASETAFEALLKRYPDNLEYKVRWARMNVDHGTEEDYTFATGLLREVLEKNKDYAPALMGLATIAEIHFDSTAEKLAKHALESDPRNLEAQEMLARIALEDNNNSRATEEAKKALAIDPHSVVGKAILATIDWLADKKETPWDPHDARGYEVAGRFFFLNRRYEDAIQYLRKAIDLDPHLYSARSELGLNLMRLSQYEEAYKQLEECYNNHFQNSATVNTLRLIDIFKNFETTRTDRMVLKLDRKEADLLRPYVEDEVNRVLDVYEKKYKIKLDHPVQVELYPTHEDFAVRTLGMPGLGALGVTFSSESYGSSVALDSPSGRPPGSFHWASTLWHEMSHVFTLTMTHSRVPRWFTEGIAVHEETAASPEWGDRVVPDILMAIKDKKLLPIAELDRGFIHPTGIVQVGISYYQAGRICDFITDKWGWDTILAMLHDFAGNMDTPSVIRKELKIEPDEFDRQFFALVEAEQKKTIENFSKWKDDVKKINDALKSKDYDTAIKLGTESRDLYPDYVEAGSVYEALAKAYQAKENKPAAIAELAWYLKAGGRNPDSIKLLAKLQAEAGNEKEAAAALSRLNFIYPMDADAHKQLGAYWFDLKAAPGAVREYKAVVATNPPDAAQAHYDLARAYHLNHQDELAKDEVLASLEAAPGFKAAQKLLLELNGPEKETPAPQSKK